MIRDESFICWICTTLRRLCRLSRTYLLTNNIRRFLTVSQRYSTQTSRDARKQGNIALQYLVYCRHFTVWRAKIPNPSPLSTRPHRGRTNDSTDTLIHQKWYILHNMTILLPIGTKFYQQPNAVSSIEFSTWQAPFMSLLMNALVMKLLP